MSDKRPHQFWFSTEEACALRDGLETLIEQYACTGLCLVPGAVCDCSLEDGEKMELQMLREVSSKIGRRMGVE